MVTAFSSQSPVFATKNLPACSISCTFSSSLLAAAVTLFSPAPVRLYEYIHALVEISSVG